jgi:hypothetical protein
MKYNGRLHPITKEPIMQLEEHDIDFWHLDWDDLSMDQKADYCSYKNIGFLSTANIDNIIALYYSDSHKNR